MILSCCWFLTDTSIDILTSTARKPAVRELGLLPSFRARVAFTNVPHAADIFPVAVIVVDLWRAVRKVSWEGRLGMPMDVAFLTFFLEAKVELAGVGLVGTFDGIA